MQVFFFFLMDDGVHSLFQSGKFLFSTYSKLFYKMATFRAIIRAGKSAQQALKEKHSDKLCFEMKRSATFLPKLESSLE